MKAATCILVAMLAAAPVAAPAQTRTDTLAAAAITAGNYAQAERRLLAERRIYRDRPEILLNLATLYARTDRISEARVLYAAVLNDRPVLMDVSADRTASSHTIAQAGLAKLGTAPASIASR